MFDATVHLQLDTYADPICTFGIDANEAWLCGTSRSRMLVAAENIYLITKRRMTTSLLLASLVSLTTAIVLLVEF